MMENLSEVDPLPVFGINYFYLDRADDSLIKSARLIILPGSKDVPEDLKFLKESGIEKLIQERAKIGVKILGICGGYQILGKEISLKDTRRKEEIALEGLGLLETKFAYSTEKKLENLIFGLTSEIKDKSTKTEGYEIHYGDVVENSDTPLFETGRGKEGSMNRSGNIFGTNIHGCLENTDFLNFIMGTDIQKSYAKELDREIKRISTIIIESMEISKLNLKAS
jgi:adenosylcobyric acid synthase